MPTAATNTWSESTRLDPVYENDEAELQNVTIAVSQTLAKGTVMGELLGTNAVFTLSETGSPTGGTFTLTYGGQTTSAIAYNATAATIQAALEALSSVGSGNAVATGGPINSANVPVTFQNGLGFQVITAPTHTDSLTGGSSPAVAVATTTAGTAGTKGTFAPYKYSNTDGTQYPKGLLQYAVTTDGSGNVTTPGDWGVTSKAAPIYMRGYFNTAECVGLDANAISLLGGALLNGTVSSGIFRF